MPRAHSNLRSRFRAPTILAIACALASPLACGSDDASSPNGVGGGSDASATDASPSDGAIANDANDAGDAWAPLPPTPDKPELWYWHHAYLSPTNASEPAHSKQLIDRAVAAGYTGVALWDSSLAFLSRQGWDPKNLVEVIAYARSKNLALLPGTAPFGYSNDMLQTDPNLAEGQRVVGSQFQVVASGSGNALAFVNSFAPLSNGDFQNGGAGWFNTGDACLGVDATKGHGDSSSAKLTGGSAGNCRITRALTLTPWRMYHVRFWVASQGFAQNGVVAQVLDFTDPNGLSRIYQEVAVQSSQGFTAVDVAFNSRESTQATLYLGVWGGFQGTLWVDDITVEETALVNVLRRPGTPVKIYSGTTTYAEGTDVAQVVDPAVAANRGNFDAWHAPPTIAVPSGSRLRVGDRVSIDHYTVVPSIAGGVGACLSEPAVQAWIHDDAAKIAGLFPQGTGIFLSYDEMRHMNSCALCRAKNFTAGQLLAENVHTTWQTVRAAMPGARAYVWSDMFDKHHNAVDNYFFVEGTIAGSWAGLEPGFVIMNWNLGKLTDSLTWFSGKDPQQPHAFQQIIAGFYSASDAAAEATKEIAAARGIPGVIGAMYTVWDDDYSKLADYANAVKAAWPAYKASVP